MGLLSLHNHLSQFLIINTYISIYLYISPNLWLVRFLWGTLTNAGTTILISKLTQDPSNTGQEKPVLASQNLVRDILQNIFIIYSSCLCVSFLPRSLRLWLCHLLPVLPLASFTGALSLDSTISQPFFEDVHLLKTMTLPWSHGLYTKQTTLTFVSLPFTEKSRYRVSSWGRHFLKT